MELSKLLLGNSLAHCSYEILSFFLCFFLIKNKNTEQKLHILEICGTTTTTTNPLSQNFGVGDGSSIDYLESVTCILFLHSTRHIMEKVFT